LGIVFKVAIKARPFTYLVDYHPGSLKNMGAVLAGGKIFFPQKNY
jgi:hypothetical protein